MTVHRLRYVQQHSWAIAGLATSSTISVRWGYLPNMFYVKFRGRLHFISTNQVSDHSFIIICFKRFPKKLKLFMDNDKDQSFCCFQNMSSIERDSRTLNGIQPCECQTLDLLQLTLFFFYWTIQNNWWIFIECIYIQSLNGLLYIDLIRSFKKKNMEIKVNESL